MVMKKKIKYTLNIFNCVIITLTAFSQSVDTIQIRKDLFDIAEQSEYRAESGVYSINGRAVDQKTFELVTEKVDSIQAIIDNNLSKYFIFLSPDDKTVLEEGWWYGEFYSGYYKKYFSNGDIKEEGYYTEQCDSIFSPGQKIGKWKYYDQNGKIKEIINYLLQ